MPVGWLRGVSGATTSRFIHPPTGVTGSDSRDTAERSEARPPWAPCSPLGPAMPPTARKPKTSIAAMVKAKPMAKKLELLRKREAERRARIYAEVEQWFQQFDENGDGMLQRDELKKLLSWLHPSRPPTEANLDFFIAKATAIETASMRLAGNKDAALSWHEVRPVSRAP